MSNRTRTKLATGIYRDKFGIAIKYSVHGRPHERRRDDKGRPYKDRPLAFLRAEKNRLTASGKLSDERDVRTRDTFRADVIRYLRTIHSMTHHRNASGLLKHWSEAFGDRRRNEITELEIQEQFAQWTKPAASTRNHLRHVLISFYKTLNGPNGPNPARVLHKVRERYDDSRALPYDTIEQIFAALTDTPTKARLLVMAYTGLPQAQIERLQPHDLDLDAKRVYVRPRRKGAGVPGKMLPLSHAGVEAFRLFVTLNAFGTFQRRQLQQTFANGIKWSGVTVPPDTRPYDLRHSFLTEVYRQTGDLNAVAELGLHATLEQTARYARGAVSERATNAVDRVPRFAKGGTPPDASNQAQSVPPGQREDRGSNQYRKRLKSSKSQRKKP